MKALLDYILNFLMPESKISQVAKFVLSYKVETESGQNLNCWHCHARNPAGYISSHVGAMELKAPWKQQQKR